MPEQATQFANFIEYLKDHHLEAPKIWPQQPLTFERQQRTKLQV